MSRKLFAVVGDPVSHSLSPRMQNAGFLAAGLADELPAAPGTWRAPLHGRLASAAWWC